MSSWEMITFLTDPVYVSTVTHKWGCNDSVESGTVICNELNYINYISLTTTTRLVNMYISLYIH